MRLGIHVCVLLVAIVTLTSTVVAQDYTGTDGPPIEFHAILSADEQSAPTESPAEGCARFTLDRPTLKLEWTLSYTELTTTPTGAHVHGPQTPGGNAGVLFDLAPEGLSSPIKSSIVLTEAQLAYILTGRAYVNIHSVRYPLGELRGQIMRLRPTGTGAGCRP